MATTKKLLVTFDAGKGQPVSSDFLIPRLEHGKVVLRGIMSGKAADLGVMVYVGLAITENDLFAKLVDSGAFIENVDETLETLQRYLGELQSLKIGNVVRIVLPFAGEESFELKLVSTTPSGAISKQV